MYNSIFDSANDINIQTLGLSPNANSFSPVKYNNTNKITKSSLTDEIAFTIKEIEKKNDIEPSLLSASAKSFLPDHLNITIDMANENPELSAKAKPFVPKFYINKY